MSKRRRKPEPPSWARGIPDVEVLARVHPAGAAVWEKPPYRPPKPPHEPCPVCGSLAGPHHASGSLLLGLCSSCRRELAAGRKPWETPAPRREAEDEDDGLIDTCEAARLLKVKAQAVRRMVKRAEIPVVELPRAAGSDPRGRRLRLRRADVERLAKADSG